MHTTLFIWFTVTVGLWGALILVAHCVLLYKSDNEQEQGHLLRQAISVIKQFTFMLVIVLYSVAMLNYLKNGPEGDPGAMLLFHSAFFLPCILAAIFVAPQVLACSGKFFQNFFRLKFVSAQPVSPAPESKESVDGLGEKR